MRHNFQALISQLRNLSQQFWQQNMGRTFAQEQAKHRRKSAKGIDKGSSSTKSLADFLRKLQKDGQQQSSNIILPKVHRLIKQNKAKIRFDYRKLKDKLRICKQCDKWNKIKSIIQCTICEDNYHEQCTFIKRETDFICKECQGGKQVTKRCGKCKKNVSKKEEKECIKCETIFHNTCLKNKINKCSKCQKIQLKEKQAKQFDPSSKYKLKEINEDTTTSASPTLFRYDRLVKNEKQLQKYTSSLMQAIKDKNMLYSEELINMQEYRDQDNQNSMDFGIVLMRKQQKQAYEQYKKFPIGPYLFKKTEGKGYDVVADKAIPRKTLICEYIGEVVTHRQCIELQSRKKNDSLMELKAGKNSDETLLIRPQKFTNMARFINGVRKGEQGNVETMKMLYRGNPVVLLIAKRDIEKGQSLGYDYNAGGITASYDTSHFI